MFEELYAPLPDPEAYLARIGYEGPTDHTVAVLDSIVLHHLRSVPFEDLEVRDEHRTPSLATKDLFDKIVARRRGGYCWELNGALYHLLVALGFDCTPIVARIIRKTPMPNMTLHRATLVSVEGTRRWVDVGYGGPAPAATLDIDGTEPVHTPTGDYICHREGKWCGFDLIKDGERIPLMCYEDHAVELVDYLPLNFYTSRNPDSVFTKVRMANLLTETGSRGLEENTLRIRENGVLTERELATPDERVQALSEWFGIAL